MQSKYTRGCVALPAESPNNSNEVEFDIHSTAWTHTVKRHTTKRGTGMETVLGTKGPLRAGLRSEEAFWLPAPSCSALQGARRWAGAGFLRSAERNSN